MSISLFSLMVVQVLRVVAVAAACPAHRIHLYPEPAGQNGKLTKSFEASLFLMPASLKQNDVRVSKAISAAALTTVCCML